MCLGDKHEKETMGDFDRSEEFGGISMPHVLAQEQGFSNPLVHSQDSRSGFQLPAHVTQLSRFQHCLPHQYFQNHFVASPPQQSRSKERLELMMNQYLDQQKMIYAEFHVQVDMMHTNYSN